MTTSIQHPETDTLAVDLENSPFRDQNGDLVFRPGGHGALLQNLHEIDADVVFIKNVDNVLPDHKRDLTIYWKKLIGGILLHNQQNIYAWLHALDSGGLDTFMRIEKTLLSFLQTNLCIGFPPNFPSWEPALRMTFVHQTLNRPLRVCGIIKTETNTGGGPFWVENDDASQALQIVETAEIDLNAPKQAAISAQQRYAHITDLVCGLKDYQGNPFDLLSFRNEQAGFISQK